jgi:DNA-binding XRE family transcriptional regulator
MTPWLCRAARVGLGWKQGELAEKALISRGTLVAYEAETANPNRVTVQALRNAFFDAGIEFTGGADPVGLRIIDNDKFYAAKKSGPVGGE